MKIILSVIAILIFNQNLYSQTIQSDTIIDRESKELVFINTERMPRFPGCEDMQLSEKQLKKCSDEKMLEFVYTELQYPKKLLRKIKKER